MFAWLGEQRPVRLHDPVTRYRAGDFPTQTQDEPGSVDELSPLADHGEDSYRGSERLVGRRALVTGADSGIGRAAAIAFAREGADVVLSYREEQSDAEQVAELIRAAGRTAVLAPGDIGQEDVARGLVHTCIDELGGIDLIAAVAGKQQAVHDIADLTSQQFDETYRTNVYALFWTVQEAVPHMPPGSAIIGTSSVQAYSPGAMLVDYASTKSAINGMCKALAAQLAPKGIRVNVVAPGPVWTPLQTSGGQPPQNIPQFGQETPLGRVGQPAEMAPLYVFLASGESSYVIGETLSGRGGMPTP